MPLRAKVRNPAFSMSAVQAADRPGYPQPQAGDHPNDVLFGSIYGVRTIELNRPHKLNSLNGSMVRKILPRLKEWENSQLASVIIIAGAGSKAFCAGGDVAALALDNRDNGPEGQARSAAYFGLEYQLDHLIATYSKPYVAYMDGITMGGGVGLSVHAPFRIATERTVFAMPETTIGFFPDVGATFFLPRLDGAIGTYLALTSERLCGADVFHAGIATHYMDSSSLGNLTARLSELVFKDYTPLVERIAAIDATIEEFNTGLPEKRPFLSGKVRRAIDHCFSHKTMDEIFVALEKHARENHPLEAWARTTLKTLKGRSPTSLRVTRRLMELGSNWTIAEAFQREYHVAKKFMAHKDFVEGVVARLIDKPSRQPEWSTTLAQVSEADVDEFLVHEGDERIQLLTDGRYQEYPFQYLALPSEVEVRGAIGNGRPQREVVEEMVAGRNGKVGVREKVEEIIERCCSIDSKADIMQWTRDELGLTAQQKAERARKPPTEKRLFVYTAGVPPADRPSDEKTEV